MTNLYLSLCLCLPLLAGTVLAQQASGDTASSFPALSGEYLGQDPPGLIPELFAPGIISTAAHRERDVTFSKDLKEFYFSRDATIMMMSQENGRWTEPRPAPFSADYFEFEAHVAPDQERLYYISNRSLSGEGEREDYQMWMVARQGASWGEPERVNDLGDFYPTITNDGVMYFTSVDNDLYRAVLIDGSLSAREKLSDSVNTPAAEYNSCIAPDGSFLIFTSFGWGEGFGGGDLFVSFRKEDGSFSQPKNMGGGINSGGHEYCPAITPDGKYFFFASDINGADDIFWVDAAIIEHLRTKDLNTADMLLESALDDGVDAALRKYDELKVAYSEYCLFEGWLLTAVADRLIGAGATPAAARLIEESFDLYPQTRTLAQRLKLAAIGDDEQGLEIVATELKSDDSTLSVTSERVINALGYRFMQWNRIDNAVSILRLNTRLFPESFNVFDSYGEALLRRGDTVAALENYRKSLELNPDNNNAAAVIERLENR